MSKYPTTRRFPEEIGTRARVTDLVVICCPRHDGKPGTCLRAGLVVAVSSSADVPWILDVKHPELSKTRPFCATATPEDVETMPIGSWTWPLRRLNLPRFNESVEEPEPSL